ncbi:MAG: phosphonate C-P lyase system protein PhnH [Treponema sp.]|jgi:phosphonate C-P lyase system protein PhnH|nr:phosphonate C-P lyase system protein PhnH [Treponema sp.]
MVHGSQEVFRLLLEALANPGRVLSLRPQAVQFAGQGRWLAPALTLLDPETGFFWDGDHETGEEIRFLSGAPQVSLEAADFIFLSGGTSPGSTGTTGGIAAVEAEALRVLSRVKAGTYLDPHDSALLFIATGTNAAGTAGASTGGEQIAPAAPALPARVFLTGPGIPPEGRRIDLPAAEAAWCRARDERDFEYPRGVELVFLRDDFSFLALPRKTAFSWNNPPRKADCAEGRRHG